MLVIAIAAVANSAEIATAALIVFMGGTGILSWGVLLTAVEVRQSQRAVEYEVRRVAGLGSQRTGIENVD